jgi:hypothetical protein
MATLVYAPKDVNGLQLGAEVQTARSLSSPASVKYANGQLVVEHQGLSAGDSSAVQTVVNNHVPDPNYGVVPAPWTAPWKGVVAGAFGDGDPERLLGLMYHAPVHATPTNIGITVARCSYCRLDMPLTVNRIRWFGVGATTNVYRVSLYRNSDSARLTAELPFTTAAQAWGSVAVAGGVTLVANTTYFLACSVNAIGTTAGVHCHSAATGRIGIIPTAWPGSLDLDAGKIGTALAQFAVTAGALPATAPARAAQAAWAGGMPAFFLDSSTAA